MFVSNVVKQSLAKPALQNDFFDLFLQLLRIVVQFMISYLCSLQEAIFRKFVDPRKYISGSKNHAFLRNRHHHLSSYLFYSKKYIESFWNNLSKDLDD